MFSTLKFQRLPASYSYKLISRSISQAFPENFTPISQPNRVHHFSTNSNPQESPKAETLTKKVVAESKINGLDLNQFLQFMNNKDFTSIENPLYHNNAIYALSGGIRDRPQISKITFDQAFWKTIYLIETLVWAPITYFTYSYMSPYAAILPFIGWGVTVAATRNAHKTLNSSIMKLELLNNEEIVLYTWGDQGKGITCKIEGANVSEIEAPKPSDKKPGEEETKDTVAIHATFVEASNSKKIKAMFLVSPEASPIENVDLFKRILYGKVGDIGKFKYEPVKENARTQENTQQSETELVCYKTMPVWKPDTVPSGFMKKHNTRKGTWAQLTVLKGTVHFSMLTENGDVTESFVFTPENQPPRIEPQQWHRIDSISDEAEIQLAFYCRPEEYAQKHQ